MTQNIQDILTQLDRVNSSFSYEVWIPSLKREVFFKEMTTAQQKRMIKSIIDSPVYNSEFIKACYTIIKENCDDKEVDIDKLTILDKLFILLKMRSVSIGSEIEVKLKSKLLKDKEVKSNINLEKIYNKAVKTSEHIEPKIIEVEKYKIYCSLPEILAEYKIEKFIQQKNGERDIKTNQQLRKSVGEKFISEISKYINKISIDGLEVDLNDIPLKDKITILEKIPSKVMENVYKYIETVTSEIKKITIIDRTITVNGEKEKIKYELDIGAGFFTNS